MVIARLIVNWLLTFYHGLSGLLHSMAARNVKW